MISIRWTALPFAAALALSTAMPVLAAPPVTGDALIDAALADDTAWTMVSDLTTEVGPRLAATPEEARARAWTAARLTALGFSNVRIETFSMPGWVRGEEKAAVVGAYAQPLAVTALGQSGSTGPKGIEADVVYFPTIEALKAAPDGSLKGKIAFVSHAMKANQDGSGYGPFGAARRQGPPIAATKGAAAILIRSIGTDSHRLPHTGLIGWPEGIQPIPAAALSIPDAENLQRMLAKGAPVRVKLVLTPQFPGTRESGNVIADIPGSDPQAGIILLAAHLDSWDLGTGAIDDGAGMAIITAAARQLKAQGQPRHTIRLLMAGAEEVGGQGGRAYHAAHNHETHVLVMESDFGADRVWRVDFGLPAPLDKIAPAITARLASLGIIAGAAKANGGADITAFVKQGTPVIDLQQDGTRYFDIHHTADDTLDKIDPAQLAQNVAAWAATLAVFDAKKP